MKCRRELRPKRGSWQLPTTIVDSNCQVSVLLGIICDLLKSIRVIVGLSLADWEMESLCAPLKLIFQLNSIGVSKTAHSIRTFLPATKTHFSKSFLLICLPSSKLYFWFSSFIPRYAGIYFRVFGGELEERGPNGAFLICRVFFVCNCMYHFQSKEGSSIQVFLPKQQVI